MKINKTDIYIFSLSNIQKIITRISNIGYAILTISLTFISIIVPIFLSLNLEIKWKLLISIFSFLIVLILFLTSALNLRNEKAYRKIYEKKIQIEVEATSINEILSLSEFESVKKEIRLFRVITKSFLSLIWVVVASIPLLMLIDSIVLFF